VVVVGAECAVLCWSRMRWWAAWRDIGGGVVVVVVVQWKMFSTAVPYKFNVYFIF